MKKLFVYLPFFLLANLSAQTFNPFNLDYVDWEIISCMGSSGGPPSAFYFTHYKLSGDTVYTGKTYKQVMIGVATVYAPYSGWFPSKPYPLPSSYSFYGFYRQDSVLKRTYLRLSSWSHDSLLADYNLQVGDTIKRGLYHFGQCPSPNTQPFKIVATDSIAVGGHKFRVLYSDTTSNYYVYNGAMVRGLFLIEGLGHVNGVFESWQAQEYFCYPFENCPGVDTIRFNAGDFAIYEYPGNNPLKMYPVPVADRLMLDVQVEGIISVYNSLGALCMQQQIRRNENELHVEGLAKGLYFVDLTAEGKRFSGKFIKE